MSRPSIITLLLIFFYFILNISGSSPIAGSRSERKNASLLPSTTRYTGTSRPKSPLVPLWPTHTWNQRILDSQFFPPSHREKQNHKPSVCDSRRLGSSRREDKKSIDQRPSALPHPLCLPKIFCRSGALSLSTRTLKYFRFQNRHVGPRKRKSLQGTNNRNNPSQGHRIRGRSPKP